MKSNVSIRTDINKIPLHKDILNKSRALARNIRPDVASDMNRDSSLDEAISNHAYIYTHILYIYT